MSSPPTFAAAIFDLDGTITDSSPLHWQAFNAVLKPHGIEIPRSTFARIYEGTGAQHIFEDVLAKNGLAGKVSIDELRERRRVVFRGLAMAELLPVKGFGRFYDDLKGLGVPTMIATNAEEQTIMLSLEILKLDDEPRVSSKDVGGKAKPDPAVYLEACRRLGLAPARCAVFEDSVWGVLAAKRAGCYCVALLTTTTEEELRGAGADLIVKDYTKLPAGMLFSGASRQ